MAKIKTQKQVQIDNEDRDEIEIGLLQKEKEILSMKNRNIKLANETPSNLQFLLSSTSDTSNHEFANRLLKMANEVGSSKENVVSALYLTNGNWGVARRYLENGMSLDLRPLVYSARDDAIILSFIQTSAQLSDPGYNDEYDRQFEDDEYAVEDAYEEQYSDINSMIQVRSKASVLARVSFLKQLYSHLEKRLIDSFL